MALEALPGRRKRYHFLLSSLTAQEKELLAGMIQKLGGTYFDSPHFIRGSSHVVCGKPTRGEKFLCGCVSGKWILRKEFVLDSAEAGQWLDEALYEWNEQCPVDAVSPSHLSAPSRWRRLLQQKKGPFEGWKALVVVADPKNRAAYRRLLEAGCGVIVNGKVPYSISLANKLTHVFVEKALECDIQALQNAGVPCLSPDYISEFILRDSPPSSESFSVTVYSPNRQPRANLNRAAENTPDVGTGCNDGAGRTKARIEQENEPLTNSTKVKTNCIPLCPSPRKKRKQEENNHINVVCVDRWKAVTTFQPVRNYDNHKVPCSEFPRYIVDTIESYMEESHYSSVIDVITSFLSSRRFPPPSLLRTLVESLLPKSPPSYQKSAFLLLQRVLFLHPPSKVPSLYESVLSLPTEDGNDANCSWEFVKSMCRCDEESSVLLLRFFTTLIERDFHERLNQSFSSADEKLHSLKGTLLWRLFWSDHSSVCFNVRLRELFRLTWATARCARHLPVKIPTLQTLQSLVAMAARCYALSDVAAFKCTENSLSTRMSERSRTFVIELSVVCRGPHENDAALRMFLETCNFTWLKMHLTDMLLANYVHGLIPEGNLHLKTRPLSLEQIVSCYFFLLPGTKNISSTKELAPRETLLSGIKRRSRPLQLIGDKNHPNGFNNALAVSETNTNKTKRKGLNRRNIKGETQLHIACIKNDLSKVKQLLADGADVNIKDYAGWTPLHEACNHGNVDCVREILQARLLVFGNDSEANVENTVNVLGAPSCGTTPLHDAASNNHRGVVDLLVRSGGLRLLDAKNERGETPFDVAADPQMKEFLRTMALDFKNKGGTLVSLHPSEDAYQAALGRKGRRALNHIPSKDCEQYVLLLSHLVQSYARIDSEHALWKDFHLHVDNLERHMTRIVADCHLSPLINIRLSAMRLLGK